MALIDAYQKTGNTHLLSVTATVTASPVQLSNYSDLNLYNAGSVAVFIALDSVSATAKSNCVVPTAGNPESVVVIPPGGEKIISAPPNCFVAAIGDGAGPSKLYITEGRGM